MLIPVPRVLSRINTAMKPSVEEVDRALQDLQVSTTAVATAAVSPEGNPQAEGGDLNLVWALRPGDIVANEAAAPAAQPTSLEPGPRDVGGPVDGSLGLQPDIAPAESGAAPVVLGIGDTQATQPSDEQRHAAVDDLFVTPPQPLMQLQPQRCHRQRQVFDMTAVRRSARLAKRPAMPAVERAQRNLCRKLGLTDDDLKPIEEILKSFISTFLGPLPEHIVVAPTTLFNLEDDDAVHDVLIQYAGDAATDLQQEITTAKG